MNITHGNILAVFFTAGPTEIEEGLRWYSNANQIARKIGNAYLDDNYHVAAGVIAALSPNNRWERNVKDAEALCKAHANGADLADIKVSTFNKNKAKAIAILNGEAPQTVLGGRKVQAFYECIIGADSVCVDGHAYAIWLGQRVPTTKTPKISETLYNEITKDYRLAARQINKIVNRDSTIQWYSAADIQAITWITWRKLIEGEIN